MRITTFGTRGGLPVAGPDKLRFGGNTTCLRVESVCLPEKTALCVDAGTGFLPLAKRALADKISNFIVLQTHYHYDHTQGMLIAPPIYMDTISLEIYGPVENNMGPREVYEKLMSPPLHPVPLGALAHHVGFKRIENPTTSIIVIHPEAGIEIVSMESYRRAESGNKIIQVGKHDVEFNQCLVIKMHYTDHPERTIAYRFEERPTGKVFAFLTDEEVRASTPHSLLKFLEGCDLLIQDAQFNDATYESRAAGWGHGTPSYAVDLGLKAGVKRVGLTHHDPMATDEEVDAVLAEAVRVVAERKAEDRFQIFSCKDYEVSEV